MGKTNFQIHEMWWTPQENGFQQLAEAAWGILPHAQLVPADPANDLEDIGVGPEDAEEAFEPPEDMEGDSEEDLPPPIFQWHIPEGAPDLVPANGPPYMNGFHHDINLDGLAVAMAAPWAVFDLPDGEGDPPEGEDDLSEGEDDLPD
jgi:hypothetical protein